MDDILKMVTIPAMRAATRMIIATISGALSAFKTAFSSISKPAFTHPPCKRSKHD